MNNRFLLKGLFSVLLLTLSPSLLAESDGVKETKNCVSLSRIRNLQVLDKQNILFHMNGKKKYLNTLPNKCLTLNKHKPILYKTSLSKLCSLDIIYVLENYGGAYQRGGSCGLGVFTPITEEEVKELKKNLKK